MGALSPPGCLDPCSTPGRRSRPPPPAADKLLGTPFDPDASWTIDACLLGPTLFLDIVKGPAPAWAASTPNLERFERWGSVVVVEGGGQLWGSGCGWSVVVGGSVKRGVGWR